MICTWRSICQSKLNGWLTKRSIIRFLRLRICSSHSMIFQNSSSKYSRISSKEHLHNQTGRLILFPTLQFEMLKWLNWRLPRPKNLRDLEIPVPWQAVAKGVLECQRNFKSRNQAVQVWEAKPIINHWQVWPLRKLLQRSFTRLSVLSIVIPAQAHLLLPSSTIRAQIFKMVKT